MQVNITVAYVGAGGNAHRGQYFYSFDRDVILVEHPKTTLVFTLDEETGKNFQIHDLVSSDGRYQISPPCISDDARSVSVLDENSQRELISLAVLVYDAVREKHVVCDPQVINSPIRN